MQKHKSPDLAAPGTSVTVPPPPAPEGAFSLLLPPLQRAVAEEGYTSPTPIQQQAIPLLLAGRALDACEAAALGDVAALRTALEEDDDARVRRSSDGWTPLHLAAFFGREEAAALLIDHGAPINGHATNATRNTPLHAALAGAVSATLVRRLVMAGASVTARDAHGATPLHLAASRGADPLCDLLLARGADLHARMADGTTAAQMAANRGFPALAERLSAPAP